MKFLQLRMNADPGAAGATAAPVAATPTEAAPQQAAAPVTQDIAQREAQREQTWDEMKAELIGAASPVSIDDEGTPTQPTTTQDDPWEAHKPPKQPQVTSLRERLIAKDAKQAEAARAQQLEQQLMAERQALQENHIRQQQAERAYQEAMAKGDVDGALRARGIQQSFEEIQRQKLVAMGAIQGQVQDPRVDQALSWIQQQEQARQQQHQAWQQQQQQARQQQEYQEHLAVAKAELLTLNTPDIAEFVELPGVVQSVFQLVVQNPNLSTAQAAALVREDYLNSLAKPIDNWYAKVRGGMQTPNQGRPAASSLPAAAPLGQRPADLSRDEAWEWDKREFGLV